MPDASRSSTSATTPIVDNVLWNAYGPLKQYNQQNMTSSPANQVRTRFTRNLAYRLTSVRVESVTGTQAQFETVRTEDHKGRTASRVYAGAVSGVQHSYFKYDMQDRLTCEVTTSGSSCTTGSIKNSHTADPPFTPSGDWKTLLRPVPGTTGGKTHQFSLSAGTHRISQVNQTDGTPVLGVTTYLYDARGNRSSDDNANLTNDQRSYIYDARGNVKNVVLQLQPSGTPNGNVTSAFDARNRRVFKAYQDNVVGKTSHWFYYYDALDRLTEVHHIPDSSAPSTNSVFQLIWLGDRLLLYWQTDYPSATTTKRYVSTDETGRPVDMICWGPGSVDCPRVWAINPSAWGFDTLVKGASIYQPILFAGQYKDGETTAWHNDGVTVHRPGIALNGYRSYDPFAGSYLQPDPLAAETWSPFLYADSNPIDKTDRYGLSAKICGEIYDDNNTEDGVVYQDCYDTASGGSSGPGGSGGAGPSGGGGRGGRPNSGKPSSEPNRPVKIRWYATAAALEAIRDYLACQEYCSTSQCLSPGSTMICNCACTAPSPPPEFDEPVSCPPGMITSPGSSGGRRCIQLTPSTITPVPQCTLPPPCGAHDSC